ncbi:glycosyltransferase involved in cell wall biosynthesis [Mycobacterium sp. BK086]|uniref:glycosyltransferase n=1 Tax=Mycobacterium sp. BK086 TaxID=2512165 RepID=UPI00105BF2A5|nr:glycosyltransferase [Mycobacterium sp. BK086]TDO18502.1 glycosyltransferase involved in cell wall biosynthesis [Mycobacterium sp. BK086]
MKIAMISALASPLALHERADIGGQHVHVAGLSAAIARRGHDLTVYTRRDGQGRPERVDAPDGYAVVEVPAGPADYVSGGDLLDHMSAFAEYLDVHWDEDPPEVAHAQFWMSGLVTQLAARARGVPTVQTFRSLGSVEERHDEVPAANVGARLKLERLVAGGATWVAATCTDELLELIRLGRSRSRISVVPCGVDTDAFSTEGSVADRGDRYRIVSVGKLLPHNGFDTMIQALPNIPDAEYVIVGDADGDNIHADPEATRLSKLAAELGVADRLVFAGAVAHADMPALLRSADVVACTPWYDAFGLVALEAMACGVPVVASAVGSMRDTVVDDVTGRLVMPRRPRECADVVTGILRDSFLRRSLGLAGRDRVCARYTWDRVAAETCDIYERLITAHVDHASPLTDLGQPTIQS